MMNPFEKLLLRRAKTSDLQRASLWMANLAYVNVGHNMWSVEPNGTISQTLEHFGHFAETEDPESLVSTEVHLDRALRAGFAIEIEEEEDTISG